MIQMLNQLILRNNKMKIHITKVYAKLDLIAYVKHQERYGLAIAKCILQKNYQISLKRQ